MTYFTYILECTDKSYYIGFTDDVEAREREHNLRIFQNAYTLRRRPVKLVFFMEFPDNQSALDFEKQIKGWSRAKKEALIKGKWNMLPKLAKKRFKKD